ncbi:pectate lyase [Viridibacterium curvum]|uniref:Pectate lyase n=1 Tax=Viridibacterium curvum TaxID=1101404 RepID=A0ABP9Q970_9RHOO
MQSKLLLGLFLAAVITNANATSTISGSFDGGGKTYGTSCSGGSESQAPVFLLKDGATLKNVVLKAGAAADGVHCEGSCTLSNVKWPDVCEDAATMKGGSGKTMTVSGGSADKADDKVFQHNGKGSTIKISGFTAGSIGKLYRSCGNCSSNGGPRYVNISNTTISNASAGVAGVNANFGDKATIRSITVKKGNSVCIEFKGVQKGSESPKVGEKWNTAACDVSKSDVTYK